MAARSRLTLAPTVGVQAGAPAGPDPVVPAPVPADPDERDLSDRSDFASTLASNPPGRPAALSQPKRDVPPAIQATDLLAGLPDPDQDLVTRAYRIPRYVAQAVELRARLTRRSQQDIVADVLREHLDSGQLDMVRRALYGDR